MGYTIKKKKYCVKQVLAGITPISEISRNRKVPRRTLYRWIKRYKRYGDIGLENKNPGRKKEPINQNFEKLVSKLWHKLRYGSPKMKDFLDKMGFFRLL